MYATPGRNSRRMLVVKLCDCYFSAASVMISILKVDLLLSQNIDDMVRAISGALRQYAIKAVHKHHGGRLEYGHTDEVCLNGLAVVSWRRVWRVTHNRPPDTDVAKQ